GLALALDLRGAGVSTLAALAAGAPGAVPVVDARRSEVFALVDGEPSVLAPADLAIDPGAVYIGDGARRYRALFEAAGAVVPPDEDERHIPRARFHAALAGDLGPVDAIEPLYLRVPDAEKSVHCRRSSCAGSGSAISSRSRRSSAARIAHRGRARCSRASLRSRARSASARSVPTATRTASARCTATSSCRATSTPGTS